MVEDEPGGSQRCPEHENGVIPQLQRLQVQGQATGGQQWGGHQDQGQPRCQAAETRAHHEHAADNGGIVAVAQVPCTMPGPLAFSN